MSLPATMSAQALTSLAPINPIDGFLQIFNSNPYFIGIMMLILNIGGRFISLELPWVRRGLIFTVLFVATRNIWVAFWATLTVVLFLGYLFNENSALCIFGQVGGAGSKCGSSTVTAGDGMTPEEKEILQRLSSKAQRYQGNGVNGDKAKNPQQAALNKSLSPSGEGDGEDDDVLHTDVYAANLTLLRK